MKLSYRLEVLEFFLFGQSRFGGSRMSDPFFSGQNNSFACKSGLQSSLLMNGEPFSDRLRRSVTELQCETPRTSLTSTLIPF